VTAARATRIWLNAFGVGLALIGFVVIYLKSPSTYEETGGCSDCGEYLGRWWEPWLVVQMLAINLIGWIVGVAVGGRVRRAA
jgi:hypothetical protein